MKVTFENRAMHYDGLVRLIKDNLIIKHPKLLKIAIRLAYGTGMTADEYRISDASSYHIRVSLDLSTEPQWVEGDLSPISLMRANHVFSRIKDVLNSSYSVSKETVFKIPHNQQMLYLELKRTA